MSISRACINRPVTTLMVFLAVIILGFISLNRLPQELFPPINYPQITVLTSYEGAAPEEIETLITKIVEEAVGTVNNVKRISSNSKEGMSLVMIEFNWGTNMDFASLSVREKIDLIKERLPREAKEPIVMKYNPFDLPVMTISVTGERSPLEMRNLCRKMLKDELEKIEGVASVEITGGREREILVDVDQSRLQASGLSLLEVVNTIKLSNVNYPAGTIKEPFYEFLIRTMGEFQSVKEIDDVVASVDEPEVKDPMLTPEEAEKEKDKIGRRLIYLKDIAVIKDTMKERTSISRYKGAVGPSRDNVSLSVRKQSGANIVKVAENVRKAVERLSGTIKDVNIEIVYDQSVFIKSSVSGVKNDAINGGILAFIVLFLFLGRMWPAINISIAIPVSIMAVFFLMSFVKISLNTISLGGLALGVGMLVDAAIVVLESVSLKKGTRKDASAEGSEEVVGAITGSTFTTIAVFLPMIFVVGIAGQIFKELAFTVTFALLASWLMAMTLVPMFASFDPEIFKPIDKFLTGFAKKPFIAHQDYFSRIKDKYVDTLTYLCVQKRNLMLLVVSGLFAGSLLLLFTFDKVLLPPVDQRQFILLVDKKPGTPLEETDRVVRDIEKELMLLPEIKNFTVNIGSSKDRTQEDVLETLGGNQAQVLVNLKTKSEMQGARYSSTSEILQRLKERLSAKVNQENMEIEYLAQESFLKTAFGGEAPVIIEIKGTDLSRISVVSESLREALARVPGLYGVKTSLVEPSPETKVNINKDRASLYNLSTRDIALTAQTALKGYVSTKFKEKKEGEEIDIRVRLKEANRQNLNQLSNILIFSQVRNVQVPISELAYLSRGFGPTQIKRLDQQRAIVVSAGIFRRNFSVVKTDVERIIRHFQSNNKDYTIVLGGQNQAMNESFDSLRFALILSVVLNYMIMAAEFESLWQPFVIMFTLPLSLIGVSLALGISGTPISTVVILGLIMLGGIVVDNGIVLIDYVNVLLKEGIPIEEALISASLRRLRPILMTSLTTILGLIPLALGLGEGSELMSPMAKTVIGGLLSATFFTLFVIPAIFLVFYKFFSRFKAPAALIGNEEVAAAVVEEKPEEAPEEMLNERQRKAIELLKEKKRLTRLEYVQALGISVPTASRDLKELQDKGIIVARGPLGPGRYYVLKES